MKRSYRKKRGALRNRRRTFESLETRSLLTGLVVTEIMYAPPFPAPPDVTDAEEFEFIELRNTDATPLDVTGYRFNFGITLTFPAQTLAPGQFIVFAKNAAAFAQRYPGVSIAGTFSSGSLSNAGEGLRTINAAGATVQEFEYNNSWYPITDGQGFSLVIVDENADPATWGQSSRWRPSAFANGTPGAVDTGYAPESIRINELLAHTDLALGDWVELANTTNSPIDISGWFLSDRATNLAKYRIPNGTVVPANGFVTFTQFATFGAASQPENVRFSYSELGSEQPDEPEEAVALTSANPNTGELGGYREVQFFRPSDREVTFGIHTKTTGGTDFTPMESKTFGEPNSVPRISPIVFNEIMYAPAVGGDEYIELRNNTDQTQPLFDPANPTNTWRFADGIDFTFPQGISIAPGGLALVVPIDPVTFRNKYAVPASVPIVGPYVGLLNNAGENLELRYPGDPETGGGGFVPYYLTDRVNYANTSPWPGILPGQGPSLARRQGEVYGNEPTNWGADINGGTPGLTNSTSPLTLSINNPNEDEGQSATNDLVFTVRLSESPPGQVTVAYSTADGTAVAPGDYASTSGVVTFTPGVTSQRVTVPVVGDLAIEADETVIMNLSSPVGATIGIAQGTGTINNDDLTAPLELSISDPSVSEGNGGTANLIFNVTLSGPAAGEVKVAYATADSSATAPGDYAAQSATLTFAAGITSLPITVAVQGDSNSEGDETLLVNLSNPIGAVIGKPQGTGTIQNDDSAGSLSIASASTVEGSSGTKNLLFNVTLSAASGGQVTVQYATQDGSAQSPSDYVAKSDTLTFAPGVTTQAISITINGDTIPEISETFSVSLSNPNGATLGTSQATGTIQNDEPLPSLSIVGGSVNEGNSGPSNLIFNVNLSFATTVQVTVAFATSDFTATAPSDYAAQSGTLTFAPGTTTLPITVAVNGDNTFEGNESVMVSLSNATGASISGSQGVGSIVEDDDMPGASVDDPSVTEGNTGTSSLVFNVTLSRPSASNVFVLATTATGTAQAPADFALRNATLTFAPGVTSQPVTVSVVGETTPEPDEILFLNLTGATGASVADPQGQGTIVNDDAGATPWRNPTQAVDVDGDGTVAPLDALIIINELDDNGSHSLPVPPVAPDLPPPYYDVNGDNNIAPLDALIVINFLDEDTGLAPLGMAPLGLELAPLALAEPLDLAAVAEMALAANGDMDDILDAMLPKAKRKR